MPKSGQNTRITGQPWFECSICGLAFHYAERTRHYRTGLLVDSRCADEPTHHDYLQEYNPIETEHTRISEQPVSGQGADAWVADTLAWNQRAWRTSRWRDG